MNQLCFYVQFCCNLLTLLLSFYCQYSVQSSQDTYLNLCYDSLSYNFQGTKLLKITFNLLLWITLKHIQKLKQMFNFNINLNSLKNHWLSKIFNISYQWKNWIDAVFDTFQFVFQCVRKLKISEKRVQIWKNTKKRRKNHGISNSNTTSIFRNASSDSSLHHSLCFNHLSSPIGPSKPVSIVLQSSTGMVKIPAMANVNHIPILWHIRVQLFL